MKRKIISCLLSFAMIFSLLPMGALAASPQDGAQLTKVDSTGTKFTALESLTGDDSFTSASALTDNKITIPYSSSEVDLDSDVKLTVSSTAKKVEYTLTEPSDANSFGTSNSGKEKTDSLSGEFTLESFGAFKVQSGTDKTLYVKVTAQDGSTAKYYKITFTMEAAAKDADLTKVDSTGTKFTALESLTGDDSFTSASALTDNKITIPYSASEVDLDSDVKLTVSPTAKKVEYTLTEPSDANSFGTSNSGKEKTDSLSGEFTLESFGEFKVQSGTDKTLYVKVTAQDGSTVKYYKITFTMAEPSVEAKLTGLTIGETSVDVSKVQGNGELAAPEKLSVKLPYTNPLTGIQVKAQISDGASVNYVFTETAPSGSFSGQALGSTPAWTGSIDLRQYEHNKLYLEVVAQDGSTKAYYEVTITMAAPKDDAGISGDVLVNGIGATKGQGTGKDATSDPIEYTTTIPKDKKNSTVTFKVDPTATVNTGTESSSISSSATVDKSTGEVKVDNVILTSGAALYIEVTAQDGSTKLYYKITATEDEIKVSETVAKDSVDEEQLKKPEDSTIVADGDKTSIVQQVKDAVEGSTIDDTAKDTVLDAAYAAAKKQEASWKDKAPEDKNNLFIVTYLGVEVTKYDTKTSTYSVDLVPKYYVAATSEQSADSLNFTEGSGNAVKLVQDTELEGITNLKIKVKMPTGLMDSPTGKVFITHNGVVKQSEEAQDYVIEFTAESFSPYTFSKETTAVAKVSEKDYADFETAVKAALPTEESGTGEITLQTGAKAVEADGLKANVSAPEGSLKTFSIKVSKDGSGVDLDKVEISVSGYSVTKAPAEDGNSVTFTFTKTTSSGSSSGGGGGVSSSATVTTPAATNGSYTVSDKNAKAGDTVKVTPKANTGYVVDQVTVTDKNGKAVSVTANSDGTYSFVMPEKAAQPVTVKVTFKLDTSSAADKFTDVDKNAWYIDAVNYVVEKGLMDGTGATTFAPNATTTRAMIVTILYRLEGEPGVTKDVKFTDVASGQWYSDAINWAATNGIVNGYGENKFGPNDNVTREQMTAILYRYASYKGYNVSGQANLNGYTDANTINDWAINAMRWAVSAGLIQGTSNTTISPVADSTRAQIATVLMRFCENIAK